MITITNLIAALIAIISIVNQSPSIPPTVKAEIVGQIIDVVGQRNEQPVQASTVLASGSVQKVSADPVPLPGQPAQLSVGPENADGSRTVSAVMNGAGRMSFQIRFGSPQKSDPVAAGGATETGQQLADLYSEGEYLWQVESEDSAGTPLATTTGEFIISDN